MANLSTILSDLKKQQAAAQLAALTGPWLVIGLLCGLLCNLRPQFDNAGLTKSSPQYELPKIVHCWLYSGLRHPLNVMALSLGTRLGSYKEAPL